MKSEARVLASCTLVKLPLEQFHARTATIPLISCSEYPNLPAASQTKWTRISTRFRFHDGRLQRRHCSGGCIEAIDVELVHSKIGNDGELIVRRNIDGVRMGLRLEGGSFPFPMWFTNVVSSPSDPSSRIRKFVTLLLPKFASIP
jgi:hypothetical protein